MAKCTSKHGLLQKLGLINPSNFVNKSTVFLSFIQFFILLTIPYSLLPFLSLKVFRCYLRGILGLAEVLLVFGADVRQNTLT